MSDLPMADGRPARYCAVPVDVVAEIELLLLPAVLTNDRRGIVRAMRELSRLLGLQGEKPEALELLARGLL